MNESELFRIKKIIDDITNEIYQNFESDSLSEVDSLLDKRDAYLKQIMNHVETTYLQDMLEINQKMIERIGKEKDQLQKIILNIGHMQNYID